MIRVRFIAASALAALATAAIGGAAPAPAASGDYWRDCGERIVGEALIVHTKSHAVSCKIARKVAKEYAYNGDRHPIGFDCTRPDTAPSGEVSKGVCTREGARVKVVFGI